MNLFLYWIVRVYARVLNLYPRRFRDEFAVEMHAVFRDAVVDAAKAGILPWLLVCGREFIGLPLNILKELWHEIQGKEPNMQSTELSSWQPGSWADSALAGLPQIYPTPAVASDSPQTNNAKIYFTLRFSADSLPRLATISYSIC